MLTSKQRVMAAVNHQEPDRIPIDLSGHRASGMAAMAYNRLKKHLGIQSGDIYVYDMVQQLAIIEPEVMEFLGVDTVELGRAFAQSPEYWHDWELPDGTPCKIPGFIRPVKVGRDWHIYHEDRTLIAVQREGCNYFEQVCWPLASHEQEKFDNIKEKMNYVMWAAMGAPPAPLGYDPAGLKALREGAVRLSSASDRAIQFWSKPQAEGPHIPGMAHGPPPHIVSAFPGLSEPACAAKVERSRLISGEPHRGQTGGAGRSPARTRNSAFASHMEQWYSRIGIGPSPGAGF